MDKRIMVVRDEIQKNDAFNFSAREIWALEYTERERKLREEREQREREQF